MSAEQFDCPGCGAQFELDPKAGKLQCPYCGLEKSIPRTKDDIRELDFHEHLEKAAEHEPVQENQTLTCPSCHATFTSEPGITSTACPFCGTNIVTTSQSSKAIKPKAVLPFEVTKRQAGEAFRKWLQSLWFVPGWLKREAHRRDSLTGIYIPCWTYDCSTTSHYQGRKGEHYYVTERVAVIENGKRVTRDRKVRKTRWYPASGWVMRKFDDIMVLAARSLPRRYAERLDPWDLENLSPYSDEYLSGFRTETYQVELGEGFEEARSTIDGRIKEAVRTDIGGDDQQILDVKTQYDEITFKHILLPIWISAYRFKDKVYRFLVNGRTGEVQSERPWSWVKIVLAILAGAAAVTTLVFLLQD